MPNIKFKAPEKIPEDFEGFKEIELEHRRKKDETDEVIDYSSDPDEAAEKKNTAKVIEMPNMEERETRLNELEKQESHVHTISDLYGFFAEASENTEDTEIKSRFKLQVVKIQLALSAAGLNPEDVYVGHLNGALGIFNTVDRKITLDINLLEDLSVEGHLIKTVALHEKAHDKGFIDEGAAQLKAEKDGATDKGFYQDQKRKIEETFKRMSINNFLENYKDKRGLMRKYLEIGLKYKYGKPSEKAKLKAEYKKRKFLGFTISKSPIEQATEEERQRLGNKLEKTLPLFYDQLSATGYDWYAEIREILEEIAV
jgi:hypothetical protein